MNIGTITKPNQKGQIVIPKEYREELGIDSNRFLNLVLRGRGIYIYPVVDVVIDSGNQSSYLKILERTQGSWLNDDWNISRKRRKKIELKASKKRKRLW
jgi:AbrB family looped-hinge helix DNA binding protein